MISTIAAWLRTNRNYCNEHEICLCSAIAATFSEMLSKSKWKQWCGAPCMHIAPCASRRKWTKWEHTTNSTENCEILLLNASTLALHVHKNMDSYSYGTLASVHDNNRCTTAFKTKWIMVFRWKKLILWRETSVFCGFSSAATQKRGSFGCHFAALEQ